VGKTVVVNIACPDEACRATATGTVRVPATGRTRARTFKLTGTAATVGTGAAVTVRLRTSTGARAAIRRAIGAHRRVFANVSVRVTDGSGNVRTLTRRVALKG
jgi:hypothetical protein